MTQWWKERTFRGSSAASFVSHLCPCSYSAWSDLTSVAGARNRGRRESARIQYGDLPPARRARTAKPAVRQLGGWSAACPSARGPRAGSAGATGCEAVNPARDRALRARPSRGHHCRCSPFIAHSEQSPGSAANKYPESPSTQGTRNRPVIGRSRAERCEDPSLVTTKTGILGESRTGPPITGRQSARLDELDSGSLFEKREILVVE